MDIKAKINNLGNVWKTIEALYLLTLVIYIVVYFAAGAASIAAFYAFTAYSIITVVALIICFVQRNWFTILFDGILAFFIIMDYVAKAGLY